MVKYSDLSTNQHVFVRHFALLEITPFPGPCTSIKRTWERRSVNARVTKLYRNDSNGNPLFNKNPCRLNCSYFITAPSPNMAPHPTPTTSFWKYFNLAKELPHISYIGTFRLIRYHSQGSLSLQLNSNALIERKPIADHFEFILARAPTSKQGDIGAVQDRMHLLPTHPSRAEEEGPPDGGTVRWTIAVPWGQIWSVASRCSVRACCCLL